MANKTRQVLINVALIVVFVFLAGAIIFYFLADIQVSIAHNLEKDYRWKKAKEKYRLATKLDPFNSEYFLAYGNFLMYQNNYGKSRTGLPGEAEELYENAIKLNPECAECYLKLGTALISENKIDKAFKNFKKALENDPNGFNTAYVAGYFGLSIWTHLNENEKMIMLDRLRYGLKLRPWYSEYIYPRLLQETQSGKMLNLIGSGIEVEQWVDLKDIENVKKDASRAGAHDRISTSTWQGMSLSKNNIYKNGNMYWNGTIYGAMLFPKGDVLIKIKAKGSPAGGLYPYMLVSLDGKLIGSAYVDSAAPKAYSFALDMNGGIKVLGVSFTNDGSNIKEDRNLYIGEARVIKVNECE